MLIKLSSRLLFRGKLTNKNILEKLFSLSFRGLSPLIFRGFSLLSGSGLNWAPLRRPLLCWGAILGMWFQQLKALACRPWWEARPKDTLEMTAQGVHLHHLRSVCLGEHIA